MNILKLTILLACSIFCLTPVYAQSTGTTARKSDKKVSIEECLNRKVTIFEFMGIDLGVSGAALDALKNVKDQASFKEACRLLQVYNGLSAKINANAENYGLNNAPNLAKNLKEYRVAAKQLTAAITQEVNRILNSGFKTREFLLKMADFHDQRAKSALNIQRYLEKY